MRSFRHASRAIGVLASEGPVAFSRRLVEKVRAKLGWPSRQHRHFLQQQARADEIFDLQLGIDTGGTQRLHKLTIDTDTAKYGSSHIASHPSDFLAALESVDLPLEDLTFVDLGSGKGRALVLARTFAFPRIIGIEFARELHETAQRNIAILASSDASAGRIECVCADASTYVLPDEPLLLFLFHPFDSPVMTLVAANALASWRASPRPMRVVYLNPVHLDDWLQAGWQPIVQEGYCAVLAPA